MNSNANGHPTCSEFAQKMIGTFRGIMQWEQLDRLWDTVLESPDDWYAIIAGAPEPEAKLPGEDLKRLLASLNTLLREEHAHDYCGIVYTDNPTQPTLIKIFDPNALGSACSGSTTPTPPRWLLSKIKPEALLDPSPVPNSRKRWWQNILGRGA